MRDAQTELLRGFEVFFKSQNVQFRNLKADQSNLDAATDLRLRAMEDRFVADRKAAGPRCVEPHSKRAGFEIGFAMRKRSNWIRATIWPARGVSPEPSVEISAVDGRRLRSKERFLKSGSAPRVDLSVEYHPRPRPCR